jgi:5-methylcytosine-specific restriction enzyme subunit McrC
MITDTSLISTNRRIVVETKFVPEALVVGRRGDQARVRASHLYQLFAYLMNLAAKEASRKIEGVLLYPRVNRAVDLALVLHGHPVQIRTLDLSLPWLRIEECLLQSISSRP